MEKAGGGNHHTLDTLVNILGSLSYQASKGTGWDSCFQLLVDPQLGMVSRLTAPPLKALMPTCKGWCQALVAVWLLQLLAHLPTVGLVLAQDGAVLLQPPQGLEGLELVLQHGS